MIQANELRIGNYLNIHGEPAPIAIGWFYAVAQNKLPPHEPIPLTDEWLERLGFTNRCMRVDEYSGMRIDEKGRFELMDYSDGQTVSSWDHRIEFVHQLQNLVFALAGEELTIKQPI